MAEYIARVELHGASWPKDYEKLHTLMANHGFTNCISDGAKEWRLPTGTYWSTGRIDNAALVRDAVKACADQTGFRNESIVVKSGGWGSALTKLC